MYRIELKEFRSVFFLSLLTIMMMVVEATFVCLFPHELIGLASLLTVLALLVGISCFVLSYAWRLFRYKGHVFSAVVPTLSWLAFLIAMWLASFNIGPILARQILTQALADQFQQVSQTSNYGKVVYGSLNATLFDFVALCRSPEGTCGSLRKDVGVLCAEVTYKFDNGVYLSHRACS